ncbi:hypothetical protein L1987_02794 [Smallanthus sonchifolius]|uniref:Uncharacterized protein n=1 Tax=Smallanthus sonchifolius TaxID=185202 RepID=A0ACB9K8Y8_9ASTR|nr:hypothetical protein L1987_02794 [Smallanthus sonchifolius]
MAVAGLIPYPGSGCRSFPATVESRILCRYYQIGSILLDGVGEIWEIKIVEKDHIKLMARVCVYDDLNVFNISKVVCGKDHDFANLNLQVVFKEKLSMNMLLLVLDDV